MTPPHRTNPDKSELNLVSSRMTAERRARLLVVSNRLPVTIKGNPGNEQGWTYHLSSGGLVSALSFEVEPERRDRLTEELMDMHACKPVFISNEIADLHYNGFSNGTLWPLFHYLPGEIDFDEAQWDGYYRANVAFAMAIKQVAQDGDLIWVQDYHLMLLPAMLKEALSDMPNIKIGFFLHTPFPSSEVYRVLPVRKQILRGVLQSDLIGFHTYDYARHFLSSCARILNLQTMPNGVECDGRFVNVGTFPIGIDPDKFIKGLDDPAVHEQMAELEARFEGKKLLVGVDRLDYIKGVPHKLYAFDLFLQRYPEFQGKVTLLQVAVPTRTEVEEYKNLRTCVNELVGRINGRYGTFNFTPVHYLYRSIPFSELVALYRVADVCVVTSTRDGMNLVSYEYIATQKDKSGVLILSEFAGAAQSMNGAFIVNPWNIDELVEAYREALTMPTEVAHSNQEKLFKYVTKQTASYWGQSFVSELQKLVLESDDSLQNGKITLEILQDKMTNIDGSRLILIDYDLLLRDAKIFRAHSEIVDAVNLLSHSAKTRVYMITGQSRAIMEMAFSHGNVGLICEYGCFIRHPIELRLCLASSSQSPLTDDWIQLSELGDETWRERIKSLVKFYTDHTPGSYVEEREKVIIWHFEEADLEFGAWQASELQANLEKILGHVPVAIHLEKDSLTIRPALVDYSIAMRRVMTDLEKADSACGLIACISNLVDDLKLSSIATQWPSIKQILPICMSKKKMTSNGYHIDNAKELLPLLNGLANQ